MSIYPWKRFWCPRNAGYHLADDGYLYDPDSEYGNHVNSQLVPLVAFAECPCLVMLGEPGIGKSTEFETEVRRVEAETTTSHQTIRIDLKEYQTDGRLVADAFENDTIRRWVDGDHTLTLSFDSLDEGRLEVCNIANILAGQLRRIASHAARLRLRIACRTAEWPASLEHALEVIWGQQAVSVIELTPLRRCDVIAAAEAEGIDPDSFLNEIAQKEVQPFAINPITLKFLMGLYTQSSQLPSTKRSIYEAGCLTLCDESSQSRRDSGHFGHLSAAQRLQIASRIAACTVFSGRSTIDTSARPKPSPDTMTIADLAGGWEQVRDDRFDVTEADVREVLSTTVFSGRGFERLGFAHWTYAEFLAARYLIQREMDAKQVGSLIFHPEYETRIVPQLAETAAWIGVADERIFERMMSGDPQVLLRSDVATADDLVKERLVRRLVEGFQNDELDDLDWKLRNHYGKLSHSRLTGQLECLILDKTQKTVTRRFIADVAEKCQETGLLNALTMVALDESDDPHIRSQASHAIVRIGDVAAIEQLKPLALGQAGEDLDDELRGSALHGLWPRRLITSEELFSTLIRPQQESFMGSYRAFLNYELVKHLVPDEVATGLRWCSQQTIDRGGLDDFQDVTAEIVRQSISHLDVSTVLDAFVEYVVSRLTQNEELAIAEDEYDAISTTDRRKIIMAVVSRMDDPKMHVWELVIGQPPLAIADDLEWLLEQSTTAETTDDRQQWAELARIRFLHSDRSKLDHVLGYCESNRTVREAFADLFEPVEIDSETADIMRSKYNYYLELEERSRKHLEPQLLNPPPEQLVGLCLSRFEDGDLNGWWTLNRQLQLEPHSTRYWHDLKDDLSELPGWNNADSETKELILAAAKRFLAEWKSDANEWIGTRTIHFPDFSGYRALVLVDKFDPAFLDSMDAKCWANVAPSILGFPTSSGSRNDSEARQQRLIALAYQHAPEVVIEALTKLIDREDADEQSQHLYVLRRVEQCWDDLLIQSLCKKVKDSALKPSSAGDLLKELISRGNTEAETYAKSLIATRSDDQARAMAREVAVVLWLNGNDRGWNVLWPEFKNDRSFFRDVISDVAHDRRQSRQPPTKLSEEQLADLYILLSQEFPHTEDTERDGTHFVGPRESVQDYRDNILSALRERGTQAACGSIERICQELPHLNYLSWILRAARRVTLQATWTPLSVDQVRELTERPASRLVRSGRELQQVILESLERLQKRLHGETPATRDLWDKTSNHKWRPVDENAFSDYIKRHLESDLKGCGIVSLREVEIRRGNATKGERTDIYITATVHGPEPDSFECVRAIIEVKGCWHDELQTAMEAQLKNRYLKENDCEYGIYLVGWFACDAWDETDPRRKKVPQWQLAAARSFFDSQCQQLSDGSPLLKSIVLDTLLK